MSKGRRYDEEPKLNYKKVFAVLIGIAVIVMIIVSIVKLVQKNDKIANGSTAITNYFSVYSDNRWGVIDNNGNIIIELTYDEIIIIPNKEKAVFLYSYDVNDETGEYKTKAINGKNEEILTGYNQIEAIDNYDSKLNIWYESDVLRVRKDDKYGLVNLEGTELLTCEYDEITSLKGVSSNILVKKDGKIGLVNEKGQTIIPVEYKDIKTLKEGYKNEYIIINEDNKYGVISTSGKIIIEPKYDNVKYLNGADYYAVMDQGTLKLINSSDEVVLDNGYDDIVHSKGDNIIVVKNNKYGIINKDGTEKIATSYDDLKYAFSIYYIAKKDGQYGLINLENETILEFKYNSMVYVEARKLYTG